MLKSYSFKGPEDSFWFASDFHANHDKTFVVQARGFNSIREHDDGLIHNWNAMVKPTDTVFFLGDLYLYSNKAEDSANLLRRLSFKTFYNLWGNHNASIKQLYQDEVKAQYALEGVEVYPLTKRLGDKEIVFVGDTLEIFINGQHICLSHFPQRTWHKNGKGSFALAGHSHHKDPYITEKGKVAKILDCGMDGLKRPYSFREIKTIMNGKDVQITDHHNGSTT